MATATPTPPSFSRNRKWSIGLNVILATAAVVASMVMLNYLAGQYARRFYLSSATSTRLAPRTISLLRSLTNQVAVTIYYDRNEVIYPYISDLLKEYHLKNQKVTVRTVDYYLNPGAAAELKVKYKLGASTNRNFIIFDCGGHTRFVPGGELPEYKYEPVPGATQPTFDHKLIAFNGESQFTSALLAVSNPKPLKACFLDGHNELPVEDPDSIESLHQFTELLAQNFIQPDYCNLFTNGVPADCDLLVIGAPRKEISPEELDQIDQYLNQGGRALVLFNCYQTTRTGLEKLLAKWGVDVALNGVTEPVLTRNKQDVIVPGLVQHAVTKPLLEARTPLHMILPRSVSRIEPPAKASVELPQVTEIVYSSPDSVANDDALPHRHPLVVAVEKNTGKRGPARLIVSGDSFLFGNHLIEESASGNRDFADAIVNWLLERSTLLEGIGPRKVNEYQLLLSQGQQKASQWMLLAAFPGGILLFGGLVWFRRRK